MAIPRGITLLLMSIATICKAYDNQAPGSRLPVLGWSSWVALGPGGQHPIFDYCDEASVKAAADAFVEVGLKDAGYTGFHLDDCWANVDRNSSGYLQGELDHFPNGIKTVVDYVHDKGMDFGLYTCAGSHTCVGGRPGSKDHSTQDADVFAEWGVDWVKQDNCNTQGMGRPEDYYKLMSQALNATGRPICFAMCEWGQDNPWEWGGAIAQSWRMSGDHTGVWSSTKAIIRASAAIPSQYSGRPYAWNDMDMLETGNYEQAAHANGKESNMTSVEYKTEFSMWSISASPLVVTTPIMNCTPGNVSKTAPWSSVQDSSSCRIVVKTQLSKATCTKDTSFGCTGNGGMWTDDGCRGTFLVDGQQVVCDQDGVGTVSYTHLRAHETPEHLVCRLLLEKKKKKNKT
eukprot:TRINITY_DN4726_c0_g1_i4.p1 TRINITY_DN4726_c0_g1~~TRINITY_DN4726_c0_g1_i4.p1  ORF type:complete len:401 (-),score=73.61 TRINITY_DN4726_c0_g1_i4:40-1242(-)